MRTFEICSLSSLSWETWWSSTVSSPRVLILFVQKFLNLAEPGKSVHSLFCLPFLTSIWRLCNDLWQRPQAVACSLLLCLFCHCKIQYWAKMENLLLSVRAWVTGTFIFWLSPFNSKLSLLRLEELRWNSNSCVSFISGLIFLDPRDCGDSCLSYRWLDIGKLSYLQPMKMNKVIKIFITTYAVYTDFSCFPLGNSFCEGGQTGLRPCLLSASSLDLLCATHWSYTSLLPSLVLNSLPCSHSVTKCFQIILWNLLCLRSFSICMPSP